MYVIPITKVLLQKNCSSWNKEFNLKEVMKYVKFLERGCLKSEKFLLNFIEESLF